MLACPLSGLVCPICGSRERPGVTAEWMLRVQDAGGSPRSAAGLLLNQRCTVVQQGHWKQAVPRSRHLSSGESFLICLETSFF